MLYIFFLFQTGCGRIVIMWNTRGGSCGSAVVLLLLQLSGTWEPTAGQLIDRNCFGSENATLSGRNRFLVPFLSFLFRTLFGYRYT